MPSHNKFSRNINLKLISSYMLWETLKRVFERYLTSQMTYLSTSRTVWSETFLRWYLKRSLPNLQSPKSPLCPYRARITTYSSLHARTGKLSLYLDYHIVVIHHCYLFVMFLRVVLQSPHYWICQHTKCYSPCRRCCTKVRSRRSQTAIGFYL